MGRFRLPNLSGLLTWTYMLSYLAFMLIMPITALLTKASAIPLATFIARATEPVAMHAYYVTFSCAIIAAAFNAVFGFLLAWVLVRYKFPGKKLIDAAVDLPFALPTSVAGLTLATVYGDEFFIGQALINAGIQVVFTRLGVVIAMIFVSFPFVVRTMQPVMQELERDMEEAAWSLGASKWQTFCQVGRGAGRALSSRGWGVGWGQALRTGDGGPTWAAWSGMRSIQGGRVRTRPVAHAVCGRRS